MSTSASPTSRLLNTQHTAKFLDVSPSTVSTWRSLGVGPAFLKVGGRVRYELAALEAFLAERRLRSTAEYKAKKAALQASRRKQRVEQDGHDHVAR